MRRGCARATRTWLPRDSRGERGSFRDTASAVRPGWERPGAGKVTILLRVNPSLLAVIGSLVWLGGVGLGVSLSSKVEDAWRSQVTEQLTRRAESAKTAPNPLQFELPKEKDSEDLYWDEVRADAAALGIRAPSKGRFRAAQNHRRWFKKAKTLQVGKRLRKGSMELRVSVESVKYKRQGAFVTSRHTVLTLRNRGKRPVAYRIEVAAAKRGRCRVKGTRQHNAIALLPNEGAEITVCAGKTGVRIGALETLELSTLGYHYLSRVPPQALGVESTRAAAHRIPRHARGCGGLDNGVLAKALREGSVRWADLADFYSRHNCDTFRVPAKYRRARRRLKRLPVTSKS